MFKKFLAMLMALVMLVPMYSSGVFAETAKTFIDGYEIFNTIDSYECEEDETPIGNVEGYANLVKSDGCLFVPYETASYSPYNGDKEENEGITNGSRGYSIDFKFNRFPNITSHFFKITYYKDGVKKNDGTNLLSLKYGSNVSAYGTQVANSASFMTEGEWYTFKVILNIDGTTLKLSEYLVKRSGEVMELFSDKVIDNTASVGFGFGYIEWTMAVAKDRYYNEKGTRNDSFETTTTTEGNYPLQIDNFKTYSLKDVREVPVLHSIETSFDDTTLGQYWYSATDAFGKNVNVSATEPGRTYAAYVSLDGSSALSSTPQFYHINRSKANMPENDILTWSADVKNTGRKTASDYIPLGIKYNGSTNNLFACAIIATEDGYKLGHWSAPANNHTTSDVNTTVATTLGKDDKWHRYTICYDSANFIAWYYIDGVYIGQTNAENGAVLKGSMSGVTYFPVTFPEGTSAEKPVIYAVDNVEAYAYGKAINPTITVTADGTAVETNLPESAKLLNVYADLKTKTNAAKPAKAYLALKEKTDNSLIKLAVAEIVYDADGKAKVMNLSLDTSGVSSLNNKKLELFIWDGLTPVEKLNPLY